MSEASNSAPLSAKPRTESGKIRVLAALTACHTVNDFYGLLLPPLLPVLRQAFNLSYAQAGVVPFVSIGLSAILQPNLGYLADRRRIRRPLMVAGFVMLAVAALSVGMANGYLTLLLASALLGLGASTYHAQSATFLTHYFSENRGRAQGIHGIGNGLGFILAPLVVALLADRLGWRMAATVLVFPALAAAFVAWRGLQEPDAHGSRGLLAGVTRPLLLLTFVNGLSLAANAGYVTWLPSYYTSHGYGIAAAGGLTALMAAAALIAQPLGGTISDKLGRRNVVSVSMAGVGTFLILFLAAPTLQIAVPMSILLGFFSSLMPPVVMVYASELAAGERTGLSVGIVWGAGTAISSVTPLLAGVVIDASGFEPAYYALAALALLGSLLSRALPRHRNPQTPR